MAIDTWRGVYGCLLRVNRLFSFILLRIVPQQILSSDFGFEGPALLFPRARLFSDCVRLTGWSFRGRYRRTLPLKQILQVDLIDDGKLLVWLRNGATLRLQVSDAGQWKMLIERQQAVLEQSCLNRA